VFGGEPYAQDLANAWNQSKQEDLMSNQTTVADLFKLAIAAEGATEQLYRGFQAKFAHHPDVAHFWEGYAAEESGHAQWLKRLRESSSPEHLSASADPKMLQAARWVLRFSVDDALAQIQNLQEAYELAHETEHSETNLIFEFLITNFSDKKTLAFLRAQLGDHTGRLINEFPARFGSPTVRQAVEALE
jgi:rubrerythrin